MRWQYSERPEYCKACKIAHENKNLQAACEECEFRPPELSEANADIWRLLCLCSTQWEVGMAGATGLKWDVIMKVARIKGHELDNIFLEKLKAFETEALKGMDKKKDGE